ncbi:2og-fe oxygenase [Ophiostoma piceae UAMH 11346]|uniref:2og-fe oxygenase n=1 Tax=Ophiostoma piceae (strain UAMH 11346) TaxID=1262450 RepID=S3CDU8_OPHP1|nr:2og-fe oxygenase [Ophiostoma piceae UAMH 11346]
MRPPSPSPDPEPSEEAYMAEGRHMAALRNDVFTLLNNIQTTSKFSWKTTVDTLPNPGLVITGTSSVPTDSDASSAWTEKMIPLPLTSTYAGVIREASRRAPFGHGQQTLVDDSVRKTWELDASHVSLTNPAWQAGFETKICGPVIKALALPADSQIKPYKLLLYEPGSFFREHRDSVKEPGMVGTLVVCLPSHHVGGDVVLTFQNKKCRYATSTASQFDVTALAWFGDVFHEVEKLTQGYRLVMTYNIVVPGSVPGVDRSGSASLFHDQAILLQDSLMKWHDAEQRREEGVLVYPLDHQYATAGLSLASLKGRDVDVSQALKQAAAPAGFCVFLATLKHTVITDPDFIWEPDRPGRSSSLQHIVTLSGQEAAYSHDLSVRETPFPRLGYTDDRSPDEVERSLWTGNAHTTPTRSYNNTIMEWALSVDDKTLYEAAVKAGTDYPYVHKKIYHLMLERDRDHLEIGGFSDAIWYKWVGLVGRDAASMERLQHVLNLFESIMDDPTLRESFGHWKMSLLVDGILGTALQDTKPDVVGDKILDSLLHGSESITAEWFTKICPDPNASRAVFYKSVNSALRMKNLPANTVKLLVDALVKHSKTIFLLEPAFLATSFSVDADMALGMVRWCLRLDLEAAVCRLLDNTRRLWLEVLPSQATRHVYSTSSYQGTKESRIIELLVKLERIYEAYRSSMQAPVQQAFKHLFTALLTHIAVSIPPIPKEEYKGWACPPRSCMAEHCTRCPMLNSFLAETHKRVTSFSMGHFDVEHMVEQVKKDHWIKTTTDVPRGRKRRRNTNYGENLEIRKTMTKLQSDQIMYPRQLEMVREALAPLKTQNVRDIIGDEGYQKMVLLL